MKAEILFISDLHVAWDKPKITQRFLHFLSQRAPQAGQLYILGDLFDAWVGDDDYTPPTRQIRQALKQLTTSGTKVFLQLGNRDFLIGQRFCSETGITLLPDYSVVNIFGTATLLMHGDLLCTDDLPYQSFRTKSRTLEWQQNVLNKPLWLRLLAARWYRLRSFLHKRKTMIEIMDVNQEEVINTMSEYGCSRLIHGHTHRPACHFIETADQLRERWVLSAWENAQGEVLVWTEQGAMRESV